MKAIGGLVLVATAVLLVAADFPQRGTEKKPRLTDAEKLIGTWKGYRNGRAYVIPIKKRTFGSKLGYTLRPNKTPKEIDLVHNDPDHHPRTKLKGIYSLEDDTFKLCWVYEGFRPSKFASNRQAGQYLITLKKIKDQPALVVE